MHPVTAHYQAVAHADELRREAARFRLGSPRGRAAARSARPLRRTVGFALLELGLPLVAR